MALTCKMTRYVSKLQIVKSWRNRSTVWISFENPEVIFYNSYITYDLFNLISEIGGTLGLTLGASALTLMESLFQKVPYY